MKSGSLSVTALMAASIVAAACGDKGQAPASSGSSVVAPAPPTNSPSPRAEVGPSRGLRLVAVRGRFDQPLEVVSPPGDRRRAFVVEETGRIWILRDRRRLRRPFLDLSREVSPNAARRHAGGLLGLAFPPDYRQSGWFYVHFTDRQENINVEAVRRSPREPDRAEPRTRRVVLRIRRPSLQHAGGQLAFGPDGLLYIGIGDGGPAGDPDNHAQDLGLLLGKILRIAPRPEASVPYEVPADNPLEARPGARPEIWAYGLRNPYRFAFGASGDLYIADPGQARREEIDHAAPGTAAGSNYGWSCFEGSRPFNRRLTCPDAVPPVIDYPDTRNRCAVVGGLVGPSRAGPLAGRFLYGDFCQGVIRTLLVRGGTVINRSTGLHVAALTGFGDDGRHRLYATSLTGRVYRVLAGRP
jgi:glucose/arabinose dehydrogenase